MTSKRHGEYRTVHLNKHQMPVLEKVHALVEEELGMVTSYATAITYVLGRWLKDREQKP